MAVTEPFRITPNLGPGLTQTGNDYFWDMITPDAGPSYQLGTKVIGNDGHEYVHVTAHADLAEGATVGIDEDSWVSETGTTHSAVVEVKEGEAFQARKEAL